jgi:hypothetical protein
VKVWLSVASRAQAVPQIKIAQAVDISNFFIVDPRLCLFHNFYGYLDVSVSMRRWLKNRCGVVPRFERQRLAQGRLPSGEKRATTTVRLNGRGASAKIDRPHPAGAGPVPFWRLQVSRGGDAEKAKRAPVGGVAAGSARVKAVWGGLASGGQARSNNMVAPTLAERGIS